MSHHARTLGLTAAGALALGVAVAGPAAADSDVTYRGTFTGVSFTDDCAPEVTVLPVVTGNWRVNFHDSTATARFVIDLDGIPHVAWTTRMARVDGTLEATTTTPAGPLTVTVDGDRFTYRISPYNVDHVSPDMPVCETGGVTYSGVVGD